MKNEMNVENVKYEEKYMIIKYEKINDFTAFQLIL